MQGAEVFKNTCRQIQKQRPRPMKTTPEERQYVREAAPIVATAEGLPLEALFVVRLMDDYAELEKERNKLRATRDALANASNSVLKKIAAWKCCENGCWQFARDALINDEGK
jgi:hypothetical protein